MEIPDMGIWPAGFTVTCYDKMEILSVGKGIISLENPEGKSVIPVEMIRDTVMPPYHYQVLQSCCGRAGSVPEKEIREVSDKSSKD